MYHRLQRSANTLKDYSKGQKICYHFGNKYYIKKIKIKKKKGGGGVLSCETRVDKSLAAP